MQKQKNSTGKRENKSRKNSATIESKSLTAILGKLELLFSAYKRHGGKQNRKQQFKRVCKVVEYIYHAHGVKSLDQIGKKHIISFYRAHRDVFSNETIQRGYYPAIKTFYELTGKNDPPEPYLK